MKPMHDWTGVENQVVSGTQRPATGAPAQTACPETADETSNDAESGDEGERPTEEAGYGYGV